MAITFKKVECREIDVNGGRWGLAYYVNDGWSVYKDVADSELTLTAVGAINGGFLYVGRLSQLGEETVKELIR